MASILKKIVPQSWRDWWRSKKDHWFGDSIVQKWEKAGKPVPPPHIVKQRALQYYQKKHQITTLVETGTYLGDMMEAQKTHFQKLISIELSPELQQQAVKRFRNDANIEILQGDSGKVLFQLLPKLQQAAIFWLDGHYSGGITAKGDVECPIYGELEAIFQSNLPHIILIDDARCFNGTHDYPTMEELGAFVASKKSNQVISIEADIIRIVTA